MTLAYTNDALLSGLGRSAVEQVTENLNQALRALDLAPRAGTDFTPHPLVIVRAEIENAKRYLRVACSIARDCSSEPQGGAAARSTARSPRRVSRRTDGRRAKAESGLAHAVESGLAFAR